LGAAVVSLRAEREQATAAMRRERWPLGVVIGVVLLAIAGLLVPAGGKPVPPGQSAYAAGTTDPVAAAVPMLAGYVEQARGLRFRRPPVVRVADAATVALAAAGSTAVDSGGRALTDEALGFAGRPPMTVRPRRTATARASSTCGRASRWTRQRGSPWCTR